jgi:hypothetical protein
MGSHSSQVCGEGSAGYAYGTLLANPLTCLAVRSSQGELVASPFVCLAARSDLLTWDYRARIRV